jgi:RHS repeat-associated protein
VGKTTSNNTVKFTGKYHDTETQLDYFGARYYANAMGRFMSPDWAAKPVTVPYANFGDPQSLNLYGYVENGPVNRIDADGHTLAGWTSSGDTWMPTGGNGGVNDGGNGLGDDIGGEKTLGGDWKTEGDAVQASVAQMNELFRQEHPEYQPGYIAGPQKRQNQDSQRGVTVGVGLAGNADIGVGKAGVEVNASVVGTLSVSSSGHPSVAVAASGAAVSYAGDHVAAAPKQETKPLVAGGYAGGGLTLLLANTASGKNLSGPFQTISGNIGGGQGASVALSFDQHGNFVFQITVGPGVGISGWAVTTNTKVGCAGCP